MLIKFKRGGQWFINVCKPIILSLCLAISPLSVSATATTYKLIYNGNGGSGAPVVQSFSPDTGDIQISRTAPTLTNYVFLGWSRTTTGTPDIQPLSKITTNGVSANITLYAKWGNPSTSRYVSYVGSTPTEVKNVSNLPVVHYFTYSTSSTIVLSEVVPIRKYHTFLGWSTVRSSNTVDYMPGDAYSCSLASAQLFPVWSYNEGSIPSVYFDKLSQPAVGIPDTLLLDSDSSYFIPETIPVLQGATFTGWSLTAQPALTYVDYAVIMYQPGAPLEKLHDDLTIYPHFIPSTFPKISVTYALNGGTAGPVVQWARTKYLGGDGTYFYSDILISSKVPKKEGFKFLGWSRSLNGPMVLLAGALTNFKPQTSFTLYAVWQALPVETPHTLSFDANGGLNPPSSIPYTFNTNIQGSLYLPTEIPTLEGKDFVGWSTVQGSKTAQYLAGSSWLLVDVDTTLYAVWEDKPIIRTITYDSNGGSTCPVPLSYAVKPTGTVALTAEKPIKDGFEFLGWSITQTSSTAEYASGYAWSLSNNYDSTLYAIWRVIPTYTITYDANGGIDCPDPQSYLYSATGTITLSTVIPTRDGYTFQGWSTSSNGSGGTTAAGGIWSCSNTSRTLYAIWKLIPITYTITYDANGGINGPASQSYLYSETGTTIISTVIPTREGYAFQGWHSPNDEADHGVSSYRPSGSIWLCSEPSVVLSAVWKFIEPYYTITYDLNGGVGYPVEPLRYQHEPEGPILNFIPHVGDYWGVKTGYKFIGWSRDSQATYPEFFPKERWDCKREGNITLYAVWVNQGGVKFNLNGGSLSGVTDGEVKHGAAGSSFYISEVPYKAGYTFRGWLQQGNNGIGPWGVLLEKYKSLDFTTNLEPGHDTHSDYHTYYFGRDSVKNTDDCQMKDGYFVHRFYWTSDKITNGVFDDVIELDSTDTNKPFFGYSTIGSYFRCTLYAKIPTGYSLFLSTSLGGHHFIGTGDYEFYEYRDYFAYGQGVTEEALKLIKTDSLLPYPTIQNPVYVELAYCNASKSDNPESGLLGVGMGNYTFNALGIDSLTAIFDEKPYSENQSFSILYNSMGGSTVPDVQTYKYSLSDSIVLSSTIPTKANHTFLGWSKDKLATSVQYQTGSEWSCSFNSSTTLYAVWGEGIPNPILSYNANGGINAPTNQPYVYTAGGSMLLSTSIPIKTGFKFMGWSTDVSATTAEFQPGDSWSLSSSPSTTLYAVWHLELAKLDSPKTIILNAAGYGYFKVKGIVSTGKVKVDVSPTVFLTQNNKSPIALNIAMSGNYLTPDVSELIGTVTSEGLGAGSWSTVFNIHLSYEP